MQLVIDSYDFNALIIPKTGIIDTQTFSPDYFFFKWLNFFRWRSSSTRLIIEPDLDPILKYFSTKYHNGGAAVKITQVIALTRCDGRMDRLTDRRTDGLTQCNSSTPNILNWDQKDTIDQWSHLMDAMEQEKLKKRGHETWPNVNDSVPASSETSLGKL